MRFSCHRRRSDAHPGPTPIQTYKPRHRRPLLQSKPTAVSANYLRQGGCVFMGVSLFLCYQDYAKTTQQILTKIGGQVAHGPRKKPLGFGGNPDHVTLGLGGHDIGVCVSSAVCLIVTIFRHQRPWRGMRSTECHSGFSLLFVKFTISD